MSVREEAKKVSAYTYSHLHKKRNHDIVKKGHTNRTKKLWEEKEEKASVFFVFLHSHTKEQSFNKEKKHWWSKGRMLAPEPGLTWASP